MKRLRMATLAMVVLACVSAASAQQTARVRDVHLKSEYFSHDRQVLIYTPAGYDEFTETSYDVAYVFDAQTRSNFSLAHSLLNYVDEEETSKKYIVVGVCSPYITESDYARNNDYLPMPLHEVGKGLFAHSYYGGSADLKRFLSRELMPYIDGHYRTSGRTIGIGHSLSASFVLDAMLTDELFDDYIALSANYGYDSLRLATDIESHSFMSRKAPRFIFVSMGNEPETWKRETWTAGWERAKAFFTEQTHFPENTIVSVKQFPDYDHHQVFLYGLIEATREYRRFSSSVLVAYTGEQTYPVHIELHGRDLKDEVYITGNQAALGNWDPRQVKMKILNDSTCAIDLPLHLPALFKITRGSWDTQAVISNADDGNLIISRPEPHSHIYKLDEECQWADRE
ncbi:MAG: hypothetical protein IJV27_12055 [Prevotella sp.]|nr:hypothetical protein [Prevotella sp.]